MIAGMGRSGAGPVRVGRSGALLLAAVWALAAACGSPEAAGAPAGGDPPGGGTGGAGGTGSPDAPHILAIDGDGSPDTAPGHGTQHVKNAMIIQGTKLAGARVGLRADGGLEFNNIPVDPESSDDQLIALLPATVSPGTYTVSVVNQAGADEGTVTLLQGEPGAPGATGATGAIGPAGADGRAGPQGAPGADLVADSDGDGAPDWIEVAAGTDLADSGSVPVDMNLDGVFDLFAGAVGPAGATGAEGPQGLQGTPGLDGAQGPQGIQGIAGPAGPQGDVGLTGATGAVGAAGGTGPQGNVGPAGPVGPMGASRATACFGPSGFGVVYNDVCLLAYDNTLTTTWNTAATSCVAKGGDLCTPSQYFVLRADTTTDFFYNAKAVWANNFSDNDAGIISFALSSNDNPAIANNYAYGCCGSITPEPFASQSQTIGGVRTTFVHAAADSTFRAAAKVCASRGADLCSKSQYVALNDAGTFGAAVGTKRRATNEMSGNDSDRFDSVVGSDVTDNGSWADLYAYACCASTRPADGTCPGTTYNSLCVVSIHDSEDANFFAAARDCTARGADVCTNSQMQVLRNASAFTSKSWTNNGADNDVTAVGGLLSTQPDDPNPTTDLFGYACCL